MLNDDDEDDEEYHDDDDDDDDDNDDDDDDDDVMFIMFMMGRVLGDNFLAMSNCDIHGKLKMRTYPSASTTSNWWP